MLIGGKRRRAVMCRGSRRKIGGCALLRFQPELHTAITPGYAECPGEDVLSVLELG